jgi:uncharacterized protein YndB with AHSA1/START domain
MTDAAVRPVARASMLIHSPVTDVFQAFVEPETLTRFWLARASGPLAPNAEVEWEFKVPGAKDKVRVQEFRPNERIVVRWSDNTTVTWTFSSVGDGASTVSVEHEGFSSSPADATASAIESTQGFAIVLCDLKILLETNRSANLVRDKARLIEMTGCATK